MPRIECDKEARLCVSCQKPILDSEDYLNTAHRGSMPVHIHVPCFLAEKRKLSGTLGKYEGSMREV